MASETEPFQLCLVQIDIYLPYLVTFSDFRLEESLYIRCCLSDYILSLWGGKERNAVSKLAQVDCKNHNSKINVLKDHVVMIMIQSHKPQHSPQFNAL